MVRVTSLSTSTPFHSSAVLRVLLEADEDAEYVDRTAECVEGTAEPAEAVWVQRRSRPRHTPCIPPRAATPRPLYLAPIPSRARNRH
ncbi:hypothetical protein BV22DRAFT_1039500 [Leucogyrophana mollusca]|uniref:Uncharacterized protein n=1 Tax=Leucogyrophana mollusca TaxID=85980 RepID=A0ACB8B5R2_9AGAM|nr:hypothetical protein BV22DRAFT_1039500 [Leucogyrophana mollusca]